MEQAIRDMAAGRIARRSACGRPGDDRRDRDRPDFLENLERGSQRVDEHAERLKALASAMRPLWTSLDDRQKRLLPTLIRPTGDVGGRGGGAAGARDAAATITAPRSRRAGTGGPGRR